MTTSLAPHLASTASDPLRLADIDISTGIRLRYAAQGRNGEAVILLHGYSDSWFSYSRVLPGLAEEHQVFAPDLRGHGDSDRPAAGYRMRELAADVLGFMDALGIDRATLVGHSMGSFVAQQAAELAPARVARLGLIGSGTTPRHISGIADLAAAVNALSDPVPAEFARDFQLSTIHHPVPPGFLDEAVAASLKLPARVWRAVLDGMVATGPAEGLGRLGIPTLVFWGSRDAVFLWPEQDALLQALPHAAFALYPDTGHALHWERPEQFVRDMEDFLRQ